MVRWLSRRELIPPSQEELEKMYIEQEEFERRGLEWDRKENKLIEEYKKKQKDALDRERKETKSIGEGDSFQPGKWEKSATALEKIKEEGSDVQVYEQDITGKYIVDINEMDERLMNIKEQKMLQPYNDILSLVNWENYTVEKMVERCKIENV